MGSDSRGFCAVTMLIVNCLKLPVWSNPRYQYQSTCHAQKIGWVSLMQ